MKYIVKLNDKNYEVVVEKGEAKLISTTQAMPPQTAENPASQAEIQAQRVAETPIPQAEIQPSQAEPQPILHGTEIKSPMQGNICEIKVKLGQEVLPGDALAVLEAMKMENDITAPCSGKIAKINITKGETIEAGAVMFIIA